jgi:two-component system, OmpR family, response regulator
VVTVGDLRLDPATHEVLRGGVRIRLTAKEFALLEFFMRHAGETLTRTDLIEHVWDFAFDHDSNLVDVHVRNLRRKIGWPSQRSPWRRSGVSDIDCAMNLWR